MGSLHCSRCHRALKNPASIVNGIGPVCAAKGAVAAEARGPVGSEWRVVKSEPGMVWIIDLDRGGRSVTNDADAVCLALHAEYPGCRIVYRDSMGRWDELRHDLGRFIGYAPAAHLDPMQLFAPAELS